MKRIMKFSVYVITAILLTGLSGCEKDPNTLLTDGIWKFENITTDSDNEAVITLVANIKAYSVDGTMQLFSDGTYVKEFPLVDDETGTWTLAGETQLVFSLDRGGTITSSIDEIKKKKLVLIDTFVSDESTTFNTTTTWVR